MKHTRPICAVLTSLLAVMFFVFTGRVYDMKVRPVSTVTLKNAAELVSYTVGNGVFIRRFVIATAATHAYTDFVRNLACSLAPRHMLLLALDTQIYGEMMPANVRTVLFDTSGATGERRFGTAAFASLSRRKLAAAHAVLEAGYDVLFTDADVVWCDAEAVHEVAESAAGNAMVAQRAAVRGQTINTGLYYAKREAASLLRAAEKWSRKGDDQWALNNVACERRFGGYRLYEGDVVAACDWNNSTRIGFLDDEKYPLGCTKIEGEQVRRHGKSFVAARCREKRAALLHYSCWSGGHKRKSMAARGMWLVEKETGKCKGDGLENRKDKGSEF